MSNLQTEVTLPSGGRLYSDKGWQKPVVLNMITSEWEKKLYGGSRGGEIIDEMLEDLVEGDLKIDDLHPSDKFFLMMKLRIHSYGPEYHGDVNCPNCGVKEVLMDLDGINVIEMPEDYQLVSEGTLPVSGDVVKVRDLTSGDFKKIRKRIKKLCTGTQVVEREQEYITTNAARIVSINGEERMTGEREKYFSQLVGRDSLFLRKLANRPKFGYADTTLVKCPVCGLELEAPVVLTGEFFRPRLD